VRHARSVLRASAARLLALGLCVSLLAPSPALGQGAGNATRSAARKLGSEGVAAYEDGRYDVATDRLERAFEVLPVPSLGLWSARALEKSGHWVEAAERYLQTTRLPLDRAGDIPVQEQAKKDAAREHEALVPRIPNLLIQIEGADASDVAVTVAGVSIQSALLGTAFPANPGRTRVEGTLGERRVEEEVSLTEGQTETVVLRFSGELAGEPPPRTAAAAGTTAASTDAGPEKHGTFRPILGWSLLGLGAGGIGAGIATGLVATDQFNSIECESSGACPGANPDTVASINELRTISTVAFIAGGVLAAGGITLLLIPRKSPQSAHITPYVGTTTIGLQGSF